VLIPFFDEAIRYIACIHKCMGAWLASKIVLILTVNGLRQARHL
jgi:hypothetical protein